MGYNKHLKVYEGYIYLVVNKSNNKKYVGQTTRTISERWKQHCNATIRKGITYFDRIIKKYGKDSFTVSEIKKCTCNNYDELKELLDKEEAKYISYYNTLIYKLGGNGYNIDKGGQRNNVLGKPIDVYNMDGELIVTYSSKTETAIKLGISERQVYDVCHGIQKNYRCLCVFRFHGDPFDKYDIVSKYYKEIYQFTLDGYLVKKFYSYDEVKKECKIGFINQVLDNPYRIAGGYWWGSSNEFKYLGEEKKPTKQIYMYDLLGNLIKKYNSIAKCSKDTGFVSKAIRNNCEGITPVLDKYIFRYENDMYNKYDDKFKTEIITALMLYYYSVSQYDWNGNFINNYDCIHDVYIESKNIDYKHILDCCLRYDRQYLGYVWRFDFDNFTSEDTYERKEFNPVDIYDRQCNFIKTAYSWNECYKTIGQFDKNSFYSTKDKDNRTLFGFLIRTHGMPQPQYTDWRIAVDLYNIQGVLLGTFNSMFEGAKFIHKEKTYTTIIQQCITGKQLISDEKYVWRYHNHPFNEFPLKKRYFHKNINCYTIDDSFVCTFEYMKDAAIYVSRSPDSISQCCQGRSKTCGGYKFFYAYDLNQPDKTKIIAA